MLEQNISNILKQIENGNNLGEKITVVGATKMVPVEVINQAVNLGINFVAENKVTEFREKHDKIIGATQHFIGHLQTNQVKYLVGIVDVIQSVDSIKLAQVVSEQAVKKQVTQKILVQINIGKEEQKGGLMPQDAIEGVKLIANLPNVKVVGLMAMLPLTDDKQLLKNLCLQMRDFFDKLKLQGFDMQHLSVGMSADYQIAIENGSNMIRLGSAIYGKRNYGGIN